VSTESVFESKDAQHPAAVNAAHAAVNAAIFTHAAVNTAYPLTLTQLIFPVNAASMLPSH